MAPRTKVAKNAKMAQVMREFQAGDLHSGSGATVTNPQQAVAIGLKESGQAKPKRRRRPSRPPTGRHVAVVKRS